LQRIVDMADERVQRDDVEVVIAVRQMVRVAGLVGDVAGQPFIRGEPSGGIDQHRTVIDPDDSGLWPSQALEGPHLDPGAAAKGQDPPGLREGQAPEVGL
jgi:hypothetical protein